MVGITRLIVRQREGEVKRCLRMRMENNIIFLAATNVEIVYWISKLYTRQRQ